MKLAFTAARIAEALNDGTVAFLADDEQEAEALAEAVRALAPQGQVVHVPSSDALPGETAPATPANAGRRASALRALRLAGAAPVACILSGEAAARRYPEPGAFDSAPPTLRPGDKADMQSFAIQLADLGYFADDRVDEPGEMAVRGEVIDIYPADAGGPARIELAAGKIAAIRSYDPITQLTIDELEHLEIGRAAEPPIGKATSILAHLAPGILAASQKADHRRRRFIQLARDAAGDAPHRLDAVEDGAWQKACKDWTAPPFDADFMPVPRFANERAPLSAMARFVQPLLAEGRALVLAGSARDLRFLRSKVSRRLSLDLPELGAWSQVKEIPVGGGASLMAPVDAGYVDANVILVTAADLMGSRALIGGGNVVTANPWQTDVKIRSGDLVVHEDHGVARVLGLETSAAGSTADERTCIDRIVLEYADGARRLVPIDEADRIWRYGADSDVVTLDKLDGSSWHKRRASINAAIEQSAKALTQLARDRETLTAPVMAPDPAAYERFADGFPFNETADQSRAISAVRDDLASGRPMDRLVIGDVGYGKTEVALRAAALAALAGFQVIVAAPTTVLVRQHLETFRRRFADTTITVTGLSRLSTAAEKKATKSGLADGSIDIVVGTGAVMAKGVDYARPGLVVIDEEQRFGAADKARLRGLGTVHIVSLSATPIPRTLQAALVGLQKMSVIATPPARRQPIRTSINRYDDAPLRTALAREKARGGQSFVVVPRIEDMATVAEKIRRAAPDLMLVEAHGKMSPAEIDDVMVGFGEGRGDILLATNIIEAGLDVPRANTMIVWRADRFGLAQLHQLRGRVGRGNRRGQVILLIESEDAIGAHTLKRLRTLATFDRLGAGFAISARDLDMRGAGDLLGDDQAGHMKLIGVDLYQHLLGAALRAARGEAVERWSPELNLGVTGALPESWIPEPDLRLSLYVRLARIEDEAGLDAFEDELLDRFGPLPAEVSGLIAHARIRLAARALRIARIDAGPAAIAITPHRECTIEAAAAGFVEKKGRWILSQPRPATDDRIARVESLLDALAP
ncbi:TRCF domain-containing protein [Novosphingobium sp. P6W]|uniref:TRCF domain-containing protein n=1 Tax=Novosphingobium sp. P6W TaxID=1609758 RepID=UPI0005C2EAF8|nr:TRCF domain-containing protein [Novosphingobium sp. P6W]AXB78759.1 DEAD/DEAH box helicase [Novosphingobium sp. P6W]KIS31770.1 DEAD/DEAH box helicase [Novosphingobium sp. P6W]